MLGLWDHRADGAPNMVLLQVADSLWADRLLELKDQPRPNRLHDRGRATFLAMLLVGDVGVHVARDVADGAAPRDRRYRVAEQMLLDEKHAWGARTADELVGRQEHRIFVDEVPIFGVVLHVHFDAHVGTRRGKVEEHQRPIAMQQHRDRTGVRADASHVARRRKAPDLQGPVGIGLELSFEFPQVDAAVGVLIDDHHVGDRLPPWISLLWCS